MIRRPAVCFALLVLAGAAPLSAQRRPAAPQLDEAEPCCNITAIDARSGVVTVKTRAGTYLFRLTLASPQLAATRGLRVGRAVSFDNESKALFLYGASSAPAQRLDLAQVRFAGFQTEGELTAQANAASSGGEFRFPSDGKCGKVGTIKETKTEQCVVTHGSGMCLFCVPIRK